MVALGCSYLAVAFCLICVKAAEVKDSFPPRLRCPPEPVHCQEKDINRNEHFFNIEDVPIVIDFVDSEHFKLRCEDNVTLATTALPRFERPVAVRSVFIVCPAPPTSYAAALGALNLTTSIIENFDVQLPDTDTGLLPADAFSDLPSLRRLQLATEGPAVSLPALPAFLIDLELRNVRISVADLDSLPITLRTLSVISAGLTGLPNTTLARLPHLTSLTVTDASFVELGASVNLTKLYVDGPLERSMAEPELQEVTLHNPVSLEAVPWGECAQLKSLDVWYARGPVPPQLLSGCSRLEQLTLISWNELSSLPEELLSQTPALRILTVSSCPSLSSLPAGLLRNLPRLEQINFSENALKTLPSSLLGGLPALQSLDLSYNRLGLTTVRTALQPLGSRSLQLLSLSHNPLGDMCSRGTAQARVFSSSPMADLKVSSLDLEATGITELCDDWRTGCGVGELLLRKNGITRVPLIQLMWPCNAHVDLRDNPLRTVSLDVHDYQDLLKSNRTPSVVNLSVDINSPLDCNCDMYWFVELQRVGHSLPTFTELECRSVGDNELSEPRPLETVSQRELQCRADPDVCIPNCTCTVRAASPGGILARCERIGLRDLPKLPANGAPFVELSVSHNSISSLDLAELPLSVLELIAVNNSLSSLRAGLSSSPLGRVDLRYNRLSSVDTKTAAWLVAGGRRLAVGGNPLRCECHEPLPRALYDHRAQVEDFDNVTCDDRRPLAAAVLECANVVGNSGGGVAVTAVGAVIGGALVLLVVVLLVIRLRPQLVARLKDALLLHGVCVTWALGSGREQEEDESHEFDVFVSFAHEDRSWVCGALVPGLERRGYSVCVHYRDFTPGELVVTQIVRAVRRSRITLLVVTRALADSKWGRAEFLTATSRATKDARPRLLAVLLDLDPPEGLPADWKEHLTENTYLSREDPWFWPRLSAALGSPAAQVLPQAPCVSVLST